MTEINTSMREPYMGRQDNEHANRASEFVTLSLIGYKHGPLRLTSGAKKLFLDYVFSHTLIEAFLNQMFSANVKWH